MDTAKQGSRRNLGWVRPVAWSVAAGLILLPLVAMQFTAEVNWTFSDFLFAIVVIGGVGLAFELALRISSNWSYRAGAAVGLATAFLLIWSNAAVGYIGDDNPYNVVFFGVVGVAIGGALLAWFRARGMALTMLAAGVAHAVAGGIGYPDDPITGPITIAFTAMWLLAAGLFRNAARQSATEALAN